jgi:DNA-binding FadR family transcriptional regulator
MRGVTLKDVHDTRLILEPAAVRRLAERPSKAAIAALEAVLKEEQETIGEPHGALALEFHEKLVELSGNETLALLAGMLHEIIEKHTAIAGSLEDRAPTGLSRNERRGTRAHARLLELIKARDAEQAERFWREHLEAAGQMMLREHGPKTVVDLMG